MGRAERPRQLFTQRGARAEAARRIRRPQGGGSREADQEAGGRGKETRRIARAARRPSEGGESEGRSERPHQGSERGQAARAKGGSEKTGKSERPGPRAERGEQAARRGTMPGRRPVYNVLIVRFAVAFVLSNRVPNPCFMVSPPRARRTQMCRSKFKNLFLCASIASRAPKAGVRAGPSRATRHVLETHQHT